MSAVQTCAVQTWLCLEALKRQGEKGEPEGVEASGCQRWELHSSVRIGLMHVVCCSVNMARNLNAVLPPQPFRVFRLCVVIMLPRVPS